VATIDLGQVILDVDPGPRETVHVDWRPHPAPGQPALLAGAVRDTVRDPRLALSTLTENAGSIARTLSDVTRPLRTGRAAPETPINTKLSLQRRFATVRTSLEDYRKVRRFHGGTVNDVILATVTGAMRTWLMTRGEPVLGSRALRAMVPMGVIDSDLEPTSLGSQVAGHLLSLPIGEPSPLVRLHQVSYALKAHKETGRAVAADRLAGVAGFAPTTFHALGSRVAATQVRRGFNLVVTNVPGPQFPLYLAGHRMLDPFPMVPLAKNQALGIALMSYDGRINFGLVGDFDRLWDIEDLAEDLRASLAETAEEAGVPLSEPDTIPARAPVETA
jgi:diacylglycerol O-acyltransferase / wax synthase